MGKFCSARAEQVLKNVPSPAVRQHFVRTTQLTSLQYRIDSPETCSMPVVVAEAGGRVPEKFSRCVFLAGAASPTWAAEAVDFLEQAGFDDGVLICDGNTAAESWRTATLPMSDAILCWVPAGTQHCEQTCRLIAKWGPTGRLFAGHPDGSWAEAHTAAAGIPAARSLDDLAAGVFKKVKDGNLRSGPEREVPLMIWNTAPWQLWYESLKRAGNRLDGAKVVCMDVRVDMLTGATARR